MKSHPMMTAIAAALVLSMSPISAPAQQGHGRATAERGALLPQDISATTTMGTTTATATPCAAGADARMPSCAPEGLVAQLPAVQVGQYVDLGKAHLISHPGRYGLSDAPDGNRYAVVDQRLVRVDAASGQVLSILRMVDAVLD